MSMATRTRQEYLKDLATNFVTQTTLDSGNKFGMYFFHVLVAKLLFFLALFRYLSEGIRTFFSGREEGGG